MQVFQTIDVASLDSRRRRRPAPFAYGFGSITPQFRTGGPRGGRAHPLPPRTDETVHIHEAVQMAGLGGAQTPHSCRGPTGQHRRRACDRAQRHPARSRATGGTWARRAVDAMQGKREKTRPTIRRASRRWSSPSSCVFFLRLFFFFVLSARLSLFFLFFCLLLSFRWLLCFFFRRKRKTGANHRCAVFSLFPFRRHVERLASLADSTMQRGYIRERWFTIPILHQQHYAHTYRRQRKGNRKGE